jgi:hypothetical protein
MHRNKIGFVVAAGMLGVTLLIPATATATQPDPEHKIGICHRTASDDNPYVYEEVDDAAAANSHIGNVAEGHDAKPWKADGTFRGIAHQAGDPKDDYLAPAGKSDCDDFVVTTSADASTTTTADGSTTTTADESTTTTADGDPRGGNGGTTTTTSGSTTSGETTSGETAPVGHVEGLTPPATDTIGASTSSSTVSTSLLLVLAGVLSFVLLGIPAAARKRR